MASIMKLGELATALGCRLKGDAELEIHGVIGMEQAAAKLEHATV